MQGKSYRGRAIPAFLSFLFWPVIFFFALIWMERGGWPAIFVPTKTAQVSQAEPEKDKTNYPFQVVPKPQAILVPFLMSAPRERKKGKRRNRNGKFQQALSS